MELFQYLQSLYPQLTPNNSKIHLASTNEYKENPLKEFLNDTFDDWQCLQKHKDFKRTYVISLIQTEEKHRWLYAGTFLNEGCTPDATHPVPGRNENYHLYQLHHVPELAEYRGRMYIHAVRHRT
ncbi:GIY-YIG nuclease family protein, partial [Enterobacter hormaechei]|nr:GIY-YIG nuclease family protein [Enterobacter hormaechei]